MKFYVRYYFREDDNCIGLGTTVNDVGCGWVLCLQAYEEARLGALKLQVMEFGTKGG